MSRLPWRRVVEGGFVAYPDGDNVPERLARIRPMVSRSGAYSWSVAYDGANISGVADSAQEASDAANEAWGMVPALALKQNRQAAEEARLSGLIDAAMPTLDPDLTPFAIGTASQATLTWLITRATKKGQAPGRGKLVNALSVELYKFRTGERIE